MDTNEARKIFTSISMLENTNLDVTDSEPDAESQLEKLDEIRHTKSRSGLEKGIQDGAKEKLRRGHFGKPKCSNNVRSEGFGVRLTTRDEGEISWDPNQEEYKEPAEEMSGNGSANGKEPNEKIGKPK
jgi:hypothetical protein